MYCYYCIIAQNSIENTFRQIEKNTCRVIRSIIDKSQNENCLNCSTILSEEDKSLLIIFITALLYRDPQTIVMGMRFLQENNPNVDCRNARNFTLMNLLPLSGNPEWVTILESTDSEVKINAAPPVSTASDSYELTVSVTNADDKTVTAKVTITLNSEVTTEDGNINEGTYTGTPASETTETVKGQSITTSKTEFTSGTSKVLGTEIAM